MHQPCPPVVIRTCARGNEDGSVADQVTEVRNDPGLAGLYEQVLVHLPNVIFENRRLLTHDAQEIPKWIPLLGVGGTNDDGQQVEEPVSWLGHGQAPSHSDNKTVPATACGR
jgi:hypothetical protein